MIVATGRRGGAGTLALGARRLPARPSRRCWCRGSRLSASARSARGRYALDGPVDLLDRRQHQGVVAGVVAGRRDGLAVTAPTINVRPAHRSSRAIATVPCAPETARGELSRTPEPSGVTRPMAAIPNGARVVKIPPPTAQCTEWLFGAQVAIGHLGPSSVRPTTDSRAG